MCLIAKQVIKWFGSNRALIRRAHKDIIVYKVLVKKFDKYCGPYQHSYIYHKGLNFPRHPSKKRFFESTAICEGGWLHAFTTKDKACAVAEWSNDTIVKMVIPKGSRYILGECDEICTSCLRW